MSQVYLSQSSKLSGVVISSLIVKLIAAFKLAPFKIICYNTFVER